MIGFRYLMFSAVCALLNELLYFLLIGKRNLYEIFFAFPFVRYQRDAAVLLKLLQLPFGEFQKVGLILWE